MIKSARSRRMLATGTIVLASFLAAGCGGDDDNPNQPPSGGGSLELNSPNLASAAVYQHTFATAGTFPYHCKIHSSMTSTVWPKLTFQNIVQRLSRFEKRAFPSMTQSASEYH